MSKKFVRLHGKDALLSHVLEDRAFLEISLAKFRRIIAGVRVGVHPLFQLGDGLIQFAGVAQFFPCGLLLCVRGLRGDQEIHRLGEHRAIRNAIGGCRVGFRVMPGPNGLDSGGGRGVGASIACAAEGGTPLVPVDTGSMIELAAEAGETRVRLT